MKVVLALVLLGLAVTLIDAQYVTDCVDHAGAEYCAENAKWCDDWFWGTYTKAACYKTCGGGAGLFSGGICVERDEIPETRGGKREETLKTRGGKQEAILEGLMRRYRESKEKMAEHK